MRYFLFAAAAMLAVPFSASAQQATVVPGAASADREALSALVAAQPQPLAVYIVGNGVDHGAAHPPLTTDTPLRIASNTKTFVAATVLRLWEQGRIDLDAPIGGLISPANDAVLRADGYDTGRITVRHLLSHSGGLYDHGGDKRYVEMLKTNSSRNFTRDELVRLMTEYADPQSAPGTEFRYSDTGYILLGEIIERITKRNLAKAVRQHLKLDSLGLRATWWEIFEEQPRRAPQRARQYLGDLDVTNVHASMDLYGGGGLVMSPRDLALFFKALFGGRIYDKPGTLKEMFWQGPHRGAEGYRLGIFVKKTPAGEIWWHSGFWGTYAGYAPATGTAIAAFSDHQSGVKPAMSQVEPLFFQR